LLDDHFYGFATKEGRWWQVAIETDGASGCMDALRKQLQSPLALGLASSTEFTSRILWPTEFIGQPMFSIAETGSLGVLGRVAAWFIAPDMLTLSKWARAAIESDADGTLATRDGLEDWKFTVEETSPGVYRGRGTDRRGRNVCCTDDSVEGVLKKCRTAAIRLMRNNLQTPE
jgi:hypothetical protein